MPRPATHRLSSRRPSSHCFSRVLRLAAAVPTLACLAALAGCGDSPASAPAADGGISPQRFADGVHAVMMADRTVYATHVVTRLQSQKSPTTPSEYWKDEENTIPLPAQMFRMGAELVSDDPKSGFTYALKSKWPLNPQNKPSTPVETAGLEYLTTHPGENYYTEETLAGKKYFTAFYADKAVAAACMNCHNQHANRGADFPEFKLGDVMGGVIVRIPLDP